MDSMKLFLLLLMSMLVVFFALYIISTKNETVNEPSEKIIVSTLGVAL